MTQALSAIGALAGGLSGGGSNPSGVSDYMSPTTSTNVVASGGALLGNLGQILQELNTGSITNGGFPTSLQSPLYNMNSEPRATVQADVLGAKAGFSISTPMLIVAGLAAFLLWRKRS